MLVLPGLAWNGPTLFVFLFLIGTVYVLVDVAMNVEAARIQGVLGRRIMSTCHGFWSIGAVVGSVMGAQFAEAGVPRLAPPAHRRHRPGAGGVCFRCALCRRYSAPNGRTPRADDR